MYKKIFKPLSDFLVSLILLLILSPMFITITFLLMVANKGTPFFTQSRPGKNGSIFRIIKFKTMNDRQDSEGNLMPDADRLTRIGRLVRNTSLDEIPQFYNIMKGDMSLVGPRPLLVEYLPLYNDFQRRRHEVKPGITGWAQVNGRNAINWEQKFDFDVYYVDNCSFLLDLKILFKTIEKVIQVKEINQPGQATAEKFKGNN